MITRTSSNSFQLLLAGQLISQVGDKFHMIALSFWVLETTGSSAKMGIVLAASLIPSLIVGLFSGAIIDRYERKSIIVLTDLIRGISIAIFAFLFYLGNQDFTLIIGIQILLSINAAFFDPAIPSIIPQLVNKENLASANSKHQFINGFSTIFGAFFAGICISQIGYVAIFFINAASFLFSALFECFIRIPKTEASKPKENTALLTEILDGYRYILSKSRLLILLVLVMLIHFFVGANEIFMPLVAEASFTDGARALGFFQSAFGAGVVFVSAFLSFSKISGHEKNMLFLSVSLVGILYILLTVFGDSGVNQTILFVTAFFIFGGCIIAAYVSFKTLIQKSIENEFSGRVFALAGTIGNGSIPLAMIIYGILFDKFEIHIILITTGILLTSLSIISYLFYNRKLTILKKQLRHAFTKD